MQPQQKPKQLEKLGCYGKFSESQESQSLLELPLRHLAYQVELIDSLSALTSTQIYHNNSGKTLDVQYIFPVNPNAAITDFQVSFGGHFIKGLIKNKEEADRQYRENVKAGRAVVYGDTSPISKDMMRLKIGNVAPNQQITIKMKLVSEVLISYNTFYEFRLVTAITPRYMLNLNRQNIVFNQGQNRTSIEGKCSWSLGIVIKSQRILTKFFSTTHTIDSKCQLSKINEVNIYKIEVTEQNMIPNKDFSLCYTFQHFQRPSVWLSNSDFNTSAMVSFIPKFSQLSLNDAENHAIKNLQFPIDLDKAKGEYIFLLDRSGSMGGSRIQKAKQSLIIFLKSLPEDSFFNVVSFGSHYNLLFPTSARNEITRINEAIEKVKKMQANMGGTEIFDALQSIMWSPLNSGYARQLFLLTDGSVDNTNRVVQFVSHNTQFSRVNCIGIGNGCSEALIDGCASMGKGYKAYISDQEEPSKKIIELLEKSLSPVISKIELKFNDKSQVQSIVPNHEKLPYILKNDLANFYITFQGKLTKSIQLQLNYFDANKQYRSKITLDPSKNRECPYVTTMANFKRVNALNNILKSRAPQQDHIYFVKPVNMKQLEKEVIRESINRQILTDLTAFICIDTQTPDSVGQEGRQRQKEKIYVESMNPQGHMLLVESYQEKSQYSQDYEDQCCIQTFELPPEQNLVKKEVVAKIDSKKKTRPLKFLVATDGNFQKPKEIEGVRLLESHDRKLIRGFALIQNPDGKWTEQSEIIFKIHNSQEYQRLKKKILAKNRNIPIPYIVTFLIIKWLVVRSKQAQAEYKMIIKKTDNCIAKSGFANILEDVYRSEYLV